MAIYFIQAGENGPIKIGQTNGDVKERMAQLQTGCPYELKLIWLYTGNDYTESDIHNQLKSEHIRGEWFHPSDTLFFYIKQNFDNYSITNLSNAVGSIEVIDNIDYIMSVFNDIYVSYNKKKETLTIFIGNNANINTRIEITKNDIDFVVDNNIFRS